MVTKDFPRANPARDFPMNPHPSDERTETRKGADHRPIRRESPPEAEGDGNRFPGTHSQAGSLDELNQNLREVIAMLLEDGEPQMDAGLVGAD